MDKDLAYFDIKDQVAFIMINHPPMNALDISTRETITSIFQELEKYKKELRVVIMQRGGGKAFVAGADIKIFLDFHPDRAKKHLSRSHQIFSLVENFERPVIAAFQGFCLGGGFELTLSYHNRYADEMARLGFPEVNLSVFPGNG